MESTILQNLPLALLPWYQQNKRDLPWRRTKEPYPIWLSEIMLQQTRVEAVKGYYARFLTALPTIEALAACDDDTLHKLWEGLGYYSRVRNLKKAAQAVMTNHGGVFPTDHWDILALPGIGEYTAGAICSIAYDQPKAAVDGNVLRVISRITEDATPIDLPAYKSKVKAALEAIYPAQAGDFTQALMELGATLCGPNRQPDCASCPCRDFCGSALHGTAMQYPVKLPKKSRKTEKMTVFILSCGGKYALQKRPDTGLLAGLWQFPNLPGHLSTQEALSALERLSIIPRELHRQVTRKHIFTHIQWDMVGFYLETAKVSGDFVWLTADEINATAALPTAFRQFWEEISDV
ncbi:MAG: A/G-specific adenine glycosylase [Ruminococcaceae bacterium]|nr:A/G-specific adenine glycosylase [Oscillospiraceae bacterium]